MDPNNFFRRTTIPMPNIDYKPIWKRGPYDTKDSIPRWIRYPKDRRIWNDEVYDKLASIGIAPTLVRIFRWKPNSSFPWHIDGTVNEVTEFAINWVLEGEGIIQWDTSLVLPKPEEENYHLAYGAFEGTKEDKFDMQELGHGCLVNTTIPHRVLNLNNIHRITVSIQFGNQFKYNEVAEKLISCGYIDS